MRPRPPIALLLRPGAVTSSPNFPHANALLPQACLQTVRLVNGGRRWRGSGRGLVGCGPFRGRSKGGKPPSHIPSPPLPPPPASCAFSNWACGHGVRGVVRHIRSPIAHRDECSGGGGTGGGDGGGRKGGTRASSAWPHCGCRIELVCMCGCVLSS